MPFEQMFRAPVALPNQCAQCGAPPTGSYELRAGKDPNFGTTVKITVPLCSRCHARRTLVRSITGVLVVLAALAWVIGLAMIADGIPQLAQLARENSVFLYLNVLAILGSAVGLGIAAWRWITRGFNRWWGPVWVRSFHQGLVTLASQRNLRSDEVGGPDRLPDERLPRFAEWQVGLAYLLFGVGGTLAIAYEAFGLASGRHETGPMVAVLLVEWGGPWLLISVTTLLVGLPMALIGGLKLIKGLLMLR